MITKVPSQILLLNTFRDILIIFCIDSHIMLFNMERKNSQKSKTHMFDKPTYWYFDKPTLLVLCRFWVSTVSAFLCVWFWFVSTVITGNSSFDIIAFKLILIKSRIFHICTYIFSFLSVTLVSIFQFLPSCVILHCWFFVFFRPCDGADQDPGGVPGELHSPPGVCHRPGAHLPPDRELW